MIGPCMAAMKWFCSRVRSITTDMGVERGIASSPNCLPELFFWMKPTCPQASDQSCPLELFPRCLQMPGWKHTWDLLIRRGLSSLAFFPRFLEQLKSIVYVLCNMSHVKVMASELTRLGLTAVAEMLLNSKFPSFAH